MIVNAYFVLGFALVAATAHAVLRMLRFSTMVAAAVALLYTFLPYHFFHAEGHLLRAAYFSAPVAALVILAVLDFRGCLLRDPDGAVWPLRVAARQPPRHPRASRWPRPSCSSPCPRR